MSATRPATRGVSTKITVRERRKPDTKQGAKSDIPMERNAMAYNVIRRVNEQSVLLGRIGPAPLRDGETATRRKLAFLFRDNLWTALGEFEDHLSAFNAIVAKHPRRE